MTGETVHYFKLKQKMKFFSLCMVQMLVAVVSQAADSPKNREAIVSRLLKVTPMEDQVEASK